MEIQGLKYYVMLLLLPVPCYAVVINSECLHYSALWLGRPEEWIYALLSPGFLTYRFPAGIQAVIPMNRTGERCGEASATFIPYTDLTKASHTRKLLIHDLKFQFPSPTLALWELPNLPNTHHQVSYQIIGPKRLPILVNEHWSGISLFNFKKHSKSQKHLASIFF